MMRESQGIHQLKMLLDNLDDGQAIILIHVEKTQKALYDTLVEYIETREKEKMKPGAGNIFLAKNRYNNILGHVSLVYSYLSGYFELRDLADWDFVINLSNYDWPLRRNHDVHRVLNANPGACYIDYWVDTGKKN